MSDKPLPLLIFSSGRSREWAEISIGFNSLNEVKKGDCTTWAKTVALWGTAKQFWKHFYRYCKLKKYKFTIERLFKILINMNTSKIKNKI